MKSAASSAGREVTVSSWLSPGRQARAGPARRTCRRGLWGPGVGLARGLKGSCSNAARAQGPELTRRPDTARGSRTARAGRRLSGSTETHEKRPRQVEQQKVGVENGKRQVQTSFTGKLLMVRTENPPSKAYSGSLFL